MSSVSTTAVSGTATRQSAWRQRLQQLLAFVGLLLIVLIFALTTQAFATGTNAVNILYSSVVIGVMSLGATLVITTGGIDLSAGTGMALCAVMAATFITRWGLPIWLGVLLALLFGALIGAINGMNIAILGLPPFIATLAMMMVAGGLALVISNVAPMYFDTKAHAGYMWISNGNIIPGSGFPNAVIVLAIAAVVAYVLFSKTVLGRYTISIGSNIEATALSGINTKKWLVIVYAVAGVFTALGGIMISARLGSAQPATGQGYELYVIAAVVIGGTSLSGGRGSIIGTIIGSLIIATIQNGLQLNVATVPQQWQNVILGVVILVVVFIDQLRTRRATAS